MEVLKRRYRVFTLQEWLSSILSLHTMESQERLCTNDDIMSYRSLMTDVCVCEDQLISPHPMKLFKLSFTSQREVVMKSIESLLKNYGFGKNVLADGFCLLSQDQFAPQHCRVNVESRYPNSSVSRLFYSEWEILLSRIGDEVMKYMLENTSLFYKISKTCFVQLTGMAVNNIPDNADFMKDKKEVSIDNTNPEQTHVERDAIIGTGTNACENKPDVVFNAVDKDNSEILVKHNDKDEHYDKTNECTCPEGNDSNANNNHNSDNAWKRSMRSKDKLGENAIASTCTRDPGCYTVLKNKHTSKFKRKYEMIDNDEKFTTLINASKMYAHSKIQANDATDMSFQATEHMDIDSTACVGLVNTETSRKRKASEVQQVETSAEHELGAPSKRRKGIDGNDQDYTGIGQKESTVEHFGDNELRAIAIGFDHFSDYKLKAYAVNNTNEMGQDLAGTACEHTCTSEIKNINTLRSGSGSNDNELRTDAESKNTDMGQNLAGTSRSHTLAGETSQIKPLNSGSFNRRNVNKLKKNKKNETKVKEALNKDKCKARNKPSYGQTCCLFRYHHVLPRNTALFARNPRGRFLKSAPLSTMDTSPDGLFSLYNDVFCEPPIVNDKFCVTVPTPDLPGCTPTRTQTTSQESMKKDPVKVFPDHPSFATNDDTFLSSALSGSDAFKIPVLRHPDRQMKRTFYESSSQTGVISKMLMGNTSIEHNESFSPSVLRPQISPSFLKPQKDLKHTSLANESSTLTLKDKSCVSQDKTTDSTKYFGYVFVTYKPFCSRSPDVFHENINKFDENRTSTLLSKKENLLAERHKKLLAKQTKSLSDPNLSMNVTNISHDSTDISTNISHISDVSGAGASVLGIPSLLLNKSETQIQSSSGSSSCMSYLPTGSINVSGQCPENQVTVPALDGILPLLKKFIERHRSCPYHRFLNHHCSVVKRCFKKTNNPKQIKGYGRKFHKPSMSQLLSANIHNKQVYMFLRLCVLHMLPDGLLGRRHNFNVVMKNISMIISLGRHEKVTIGQLMNGMKTKEVTWLSGVASNNTRQYLLACVVYWWFTNYIFQVLRTFFYITDTSFLRYKLLYYRHTTWNQLHVLGMKGLMKSGILKPVTEKYSIGMIESRKSLGLSSLRFLPKLKSLRPIINMGRSVQISKMQTLSINKQLSSLHAILSYLKKRKPSLIGHGKLGMDDIYSAWKTYVKHWKSQGAPKLYFVKTDIANCYDSIVQKKLCSIMEDIISKEMHDEEYVVRKYFSVRMKSGSVKKQFIKMVSSFSEFNPDFISYCKNLVRTKKFQNTIFVDAVVYNHESCTSLISTLRSLLSNTIVKVGSHYYIEDAGISQGSVVSTLLCNMYYARMEDEYLHIDDDELLMRIVDDYLFITPNKQHAKNFLDKMMAGIPEYNCVTNKEKVLMNFSHEFDGQTLPNINEDWFPWCGVQMNMNTLEVALDCSRYAGCSFRDTFTMELSKNPGRSIKEKMIMSVSQKCHGIYVDNVINTQRQMYTNIYQIFLVTALKLHAAIRQLPYKERAEKNIKHYLGIVKDMSDTMLFLVGRQLQMTAAELDRTMATQIKWLCLQACDRIFRKCHSQYAKLLSQFKRAMKQIQHDIPTNHREMLITLVVEEYPVELLNCLP